MQFIKVNTSDTKVPSINGLVSQTQYDSGINKILGRRIEDVDEKITNTSI